MYDDKEEVAELAAKEAADAVTGVFVADPIMAKRHFLIHNLS